jgi:RNA polymerase III RPC4
VNRSFDPLCLYLPNKNSLTFLNQSIVACFSSLQFKPKNFAKAEQGPVPETKLAEPIPDPSARRSHRNNRPARGGGRGGGGGAGGGGRTNNYESEVVFGGIVGAGAIGKTDIKAKIDPEFEPELPSTSPTAKSTTKRLVKASGAVAGDSKGASGSKSKREVKSESDVDSGYSSTDEDADDDDLLGDDDEYLPTLLASLGKKGTSSGKSSRGAASTLASAVPEELMVRPPEDETELNRQLAWLTEQNVENTGLVLFQLPSVLPIPVPHQSNGVKGAQGMNNMNGGVDGGAIDLTGNGAGPSTSSAAAAAAVVAEGRPASLAELPPGKIGKLLVLRNGSVKMQIGEVLFDVSPGIPCQMLQEFAAVDPSSRTVTMLGEIENRIIISPNIDSLLSDDPLPEWKYANNNNKSTAVRGSGAAANGAGKSGAATAATGAAVKKKKGGGRVVVIESDSSSSSEDEEMVDASKDTKAVNGKEKNGVLAMIEDDDDDDEKTEDEEPKKKNRSAPKSQRGARATRK